VSGLVSAYIGIYFGSRPAVCCQNFNKGLANSGHYFSGELGNLFVKKSFREGRYLCGGGGSHCKSRTWKVCGLDGKLGKVVKN
jgi:hypothetical protein